MMWVDIALKLRDVFGVLDNFANAHVEGAHLETEQYTVRVLTDDVHVELLCVCMLTFKMRKRERRLYIETSGFRTVITPTKVQKIREGLRIIGKNAIVEVVR